MTASTPQPFDLVVVHAGLNLDEDGIDSIVGDSLQALKALGGRRQDLTPVVNSPDPVVILIATGGTERAVLDLWQQRQHTVPGEPLLVIAHPGNNSLPAALEVLARLQQDGAAGRIAFLAAPDDARGLRVISEFVRNVGVWRALQKSRIGLVGGPSDWLVASAPDPGVVRAAWGPTVIPIAIDQLTKALEVVSASENGSLATELSTGACEVREPSNSDLESVTSVYLALKQVAADHRLDAVTVRCFDLVLQQRTTGCFALAQLTDDGVIAGCEGDLVSTVGMLWARELTAGTPWMANPARLDPKENTLWLAHCTVPRSLVSSYRLRSHFESGLGVGIQGQLPPGPVTLLRIGGRAMDRVWLAEGEILRNGEADNLCRTQAEIRLIRGGSVTDLLLAPLGNHLVVVLGHHLESLERWCGDFMPRAEIRHPE
jgi:L-fucose isomerase-like protein